MLQSDVKTADIKFRLMEIALLDVVSIPDASRLCRKTSLSTIYRHIEGGALRALSVGGTMFVLRDDLEIWYQNFYHDNLTADEDK